MGFASMRNTAANVLDPRWESGDCLSSSIMATGIRHRATTTGEKLPNAKVMDSTQCMVYQRPGESDLNSHAEKIRIQHIQQADSDDNGLSSKGSADTFKILVATDTHLGYKSEDNIRGNDSFQTFEEILSIGKKLKVDFVLHGGDLFDENKPPRGTIYRTMCLFRKYCFGDGEVGFDFLTHSPERLGVGSSQGPALTFSQCSTQSIAADKNSEGRRASIDMQANKASQKCFPPVSSDPILGAEKDIFRFGLNYLDHNVNIAMPFFVMHGNHDDPGDRSHLSPLDILEAAHLINYFGRVDNVDDIIMRPILLRKGSTKIAIYGFGWIRDERLHRSFSAGKVRFLVPADGDVSNWFNIMVIHQNMFKGSFGGQPAKNCIHEHMLPNFLDLVIWGHEHPCHVSLRESKENGFQILQPGSSIATSLVQGEATPKHVFVLEIRGDHFRVGPVVLKTVRPLLLKEVVLADLINDGALNVLNGCGLKSGLTLQDSQSLTEEKEIWHALTNVVEDVLHKFNEEQQRLQLQTPHTSDTPSAAGKQSYELFCNYEASSYPRTQNLAITGPFGGVSSQAEELTFKAKLPLVRVKVDHTGFSTVSTMRFGAQFIGRVANPEELLLFHKRRPTGISVEKSIPDLEVEDVAGAEAFEIRDIVFHFMENSTGLDIIIEPDFNEAVQDFVIKMNPSAISMYVDTVVSRARSHVKGELRKTFLENPNRTPSEEDVRKLLMDFTHSIRLKRIEGAEDTDVAQLTTELQRGPYLTAASAPENFQSVKPSSDDWVENEDITDIISNSSEPEEIIAPNASKRRSNANTKTRRGQTRRTGGRGARGGGASGRKQSHVMQLNSLEDNDDIFETQEQNNDIYDFYSSSTTQKQKSIEFNNQRRTTLREVSSDSQKSVTKTKDRVLRQTDISGFFSHRTGAPPSLASAVSSHGQTQGSSHHKRGNLSTGVETNCGIDTYYSEFKTTHSGLFDPVQASHVDQTGSSRRYAPPTTGALQPLTMQTIENNRSATQLSNASGMRVDGQLNSWNKVCVTADDSWKKRRKKDECLEGEGFGMDILPESLSNEECNTRRSSQKPSRHLTWSRQ